MTFSIIIPVYNVAPYLRECLDSVLAAAQTLEKIGEERESGALGDRALPEGCAPRVELICVDDGSTDGSGQILDEYAAGVGVKSEKLEKGIDDLDSPTPILNSNSITLRVIHQPNAGVSAARNAGIDVATGDWLWFVDGDDELASNALLRVAEEIGRNPNADIIRCGFFRFSEDDWREEAYSYGCVDLSTEIPKEEMGGSTLITWRNIFRRSCCSDIRFGPYICGEDRLYTFECLQRMNLLVRIPDQLYGYRCRPQSYTTDVIKTYRGWEGELAYRMEFLSKAIASNKHIHYEGAPWLLPYLASQHFIGFITSNTLTDSEKRKLFRQWQMALPELRRASPFSHFQRLGLFLQTALFSFAIARTYVSLHLRIFGRDRFLRKFYRRIRRHGEFAMK